MHSKLAARVQMVFQKISGTPRLKYVSLLHVIRCALRYEGLRKNHLRASVKTERAGDLLKVTLESRSIYWPSPDPTRLIQYYTETFDAGNPHNFEAFACKIAEGDLVVDAGACEGFFALRALEKASRVILVEPSPMMARCLEKTFEKEVRTGRVVLASVALGGTAGQTELHDDETDPGLSSVLSSESGSRRVVTVLLRTLDLLVQDLGLAQVDFLKADLEGAELDFIAGARETIKRYRPKIAIATYHAPDHANQIVEAICALDPDYRFRVKGAVSINGIARPVMAHFWTSDNNPASPTDG